jgi:hypothetical protein
MHTELKFGESQINSCNTVEILTQYSGTLNPADSQEKGTFIRSMLVGHNQSFTNVT